MEKLPGFEAPGKGKLGHAADEEHLLYGMKHAPAGSGIRLSTRLL
jgi:hypothetical protein